VFCSAHASAEEKTSGSPHKSQYGVAAGIAGIGPAAAKKILEMRQKSGAFRSVNDLLAVRGISKNRMEQLRPYVTVSATAKK